MNSKRVNNTSVIECEKLLQGSLRKKCYVDELNAIRSIKGYGCNLPLLHEEQLSSIEFDDLEKELADERNPFISESKYYLYKEAFLEEEKAIEKYNEINQDVWSFILNKPLSTSSNPRKGGWIKIHEAVKENGTKFNDIMDNLINIRNRQKDCSEFTTYEEFHCKTNHKTVFSKEKFTLWSENLKKEIIPLTQEIYLEAARKEKLNSIGPWDLDSLEDVNFTEIQVDIQDYLEDILNVISRFDIEFAAHVRMLIHKGYIDFEYRENKYHGAFCQHLPFSRRSFISIQPSNSVEDIFYFIHELGHCYHNFLKNRIEDYEFRDTNTEINEVIAHYFESLIIFHLFNNQQDILKSYLLKTIISIPFNVVIHEFQKYLYENPNESMYKRNQVFLSLLKSFTHSNVNCEGYENELSYLWMMQDQIFETPFYNIEYAFSKIFSIYKLKMNQNTDLSVVMADFKSILLQGNQISSEDLYTELGGKMLLDNVEMKEMSEFVEKFLF
ncbi:M3 family metallopeptidase [Bacillus cereus]|nr:M3 family metallopeptidase [Bacillus cereus]